MTFCTIVSSNKCSQCCLWNGCKAPHYTPAPIRHSREIFLPSSDVTSKHSSSCQGPIRVLKCTHTSTASTNNHDFNFISFPVQVGAEIQDARDLLSILCKHRLPDRQWRLLFEAIGKSFFRISPIEKNTNHQFHFRRTWQSKLMSQRIWCRS